MLMILNFSMLSLALLERLVQRLSVLLMITAAIPLTHYH
jgi:hypothetical protein